MLSHSWLTQWPVVFGVLEPWRTSFYLGETLTYVLQQAGGNLQLYPEEKQHFVGHNERGKYNSAYSIGPLLPDVSILPAISDAILWKAGAADCEMWDGHCHSF
uniref:Uncharacterized protein n=1 Tax=Ficus carica TaxID=3494 RepID=A0AA87YUL2_FICCA|nr:hypothetical protein TIFTF001_050915 [Ficus carica]